MHRPCQQAEPCTPVAEVIRKKGVSDVTLDLNEAMEGWTHLGTYNLTAGTVKVELTDKSKGKLVYADAIR